MTYKKSHRGQYKIRDDDVKVIQKIPFKVEPHSKKRPAIHHELPAAGLVRVFITTLCQIKNLGGIIGLEKTPMHRRRTRKKLVAQRRRNARVYKGIAAASVTFCGKGDAAE